MYYNPTGVRVASAYDGSRYFDKFLLIYFPTLFKQHQFSNRLATIHTSQTMAADGRNTVA